MFSWLAVFVFLLSASLCFVLARIAPRIGLVAVPGEHRQHEAPTPLVGGLAVFVAASVGLLVFESPLASMLVPIWLLVVVGLIDDRFHLPSWSRFVAQALAAYIMIELTGVRLESLGNLISSESELRLGRWSTPITIFAIVGVINAVNMSDGMDGLLGCLLVLSLSILANYMPGLLSELVIFLVATLGFLIWNIRIGRSRASLFMGDAGSMAMGLLMGYLLIKASQTEVGIEPVTALWFLALPLIDAVSVLVVRPLKGRSPFAADLRHYHHRLRVSGWSVNTALFVAILLQTACILLGAICLIYGVSESVQLILFLVLFFTYFVNLYLRT